MRFKKDRFGDRSLEHADADGDRLRVMSGLDANLFTVAINLEAVYLSRKELRKLANKILKELDQ